MNYNDLDIKFLGTWSPEDIESAKRAIEIFSYSVSNITGIAPEKAFNLLLGGITLEAVKYAPGIFYGYVSARRSKHVKLEIGHIDVPLILHEFGHVIILTDKTDSNPAKWLSKNVIKTVSNIPVTGPIRFMGYYSTERNGYISIFYPEHQHPIYWYDGRTTKEDFCDMLLSWLTGNLADNEAGIALYLWITNYFKERLNSL